MNCSFNDSILISSDEFSLFFLFYPPIPSIAISLTGLGICRWFQLPSRTDSSAYFFLCKVERKRADDPLDMRW